jgi:hypothetical protein
MATPSPAFQALNCRIPVMVSVYAGQAPGGWITFPGGTFESDPSSLIQRNASEGISYDRALNKWVPADWNHISPDGRRFVIGNGSDLAIVDAANGASRAIAMPPARGGWIVIDYTAAGVYLSQMGGEGPADPGLWVLNPDTGQVRQLDGTQFWSQVDSRAVWGVNVGVGSMLLRRFDLQTGHITTELAIPYHTPVLTGDESLELVSIDSAGRPVIVLRDWQKPFPWHMAVLEAANTLRDTPLPDAWAAWSTADNGDPFQQWRDVRGYVLTGGIWMIGSNSFGGLALLGSDGAVRQLTTGPDNIFQIGGGCH